MNLLIQFVLIEETGKKIMNFLTQNFGNYKVIEHFQSFYRFKLDTHISIGSLFGRFEENK